MRNFISAIQFITILPVGRPGPFNPQKMMPFFPAVGILLGIFVAIFDLIALRLWSEPVVALLDVILLATVTGAFHLDGLGDTADGLLGQRSKEKALSIMKDSRIGAMGLVAVVFGLSLKWSGIAGLDVNRSLFLIIVPAYARSGVLFGIRFLEYGRPAGGTGRLPRDAPGPGRSAGSRCRRRSDRRPANRRASRARGRTARDS